MATPINQIPDDPNQNFDEDSEIVQSILDQYRQDPVETAAASIDPPQRPPQYPPQQQFEPQYSQEQQYEPQYEEEYYPKPPPPQLSLVARVLAEAKAPLIVLALCIVFGLPIVDHFMVKYIPRISNELGTLNVFGIIIRAIMITIVYYLLQKVVS